MDGLKIFSGRANLQLAQGINDYLKIPLGEIEISNFSDGEIQVRIKENVRGQDVFVIQSTCQPGNDNLMELLIIMDALRRASAKRITAVIPYYGYARQDRKAEPRVPITSKLVATLITAAGADRVLAMELHAGQIQGFFDLPVDHLYASPVLVEYFRRLEMRDLVVVSPDAGGVERARAFAKKLNASLGIIDKRRERANVSEVMHVIGEVGGRDVLLVDDLVDTAGTLAQAARALINQGACSVRACCTHPVLSGPAIRRINESDLEEVIVTDTIPIREEGRKCGKVKVLSVARLFGEAIRRIHNESSVSSLFD
ncbi:MAG: ribose-phosphate pyrophosphokinase [Candidatus Tectomicrobia bacterium]|uniref:Ribose-phosphate pyrophosphokinase n=1 Tax=Tectimicrobiota bacterium TaxID=2528274 RepID=A0A932CN31_UNCTE|nr:ribose-phosphate pyrophosphokinase [Candidatus Tectomicrobia bacterium]